MKKIIAILFLMFVLNLYASAKDVTYKVIKVTDGDTVYIDFNKNGKPDKNEKVRLNGIDTFETKINDGLYRQMHYYNLTQEEVLGLGYYGKEFAKEQLLNKDVLAKYTAKTKYDKNKRKLMSVYYDCENNTCKSYEQEVLKIGYAVVFNKSNLAKELKKYENPDKIKTNAKKTHNLDLVILNKNSNKYHEVSCPNAQNLNNSELIDKPSSAKEALCCHKHDEN